MNRLMRKKNIDFLQCVHPFLRELFYKLYTCQDIALEPFSDRSNLCELELFDTNYTFAYRLNVTYARQIQCWDIIFNPDDLTRAPDFSFNNEAFEEFIYRNNINKCLPDWVNWNVKKSESLTMIIKSLVELFAKFQETELQKVNKKILDEYNLLKLQEKYKPRDIEVCFDSKTNFTYFLITLYLDMSQVPEYIQNIQEDGTLLNPMQDYGLLIATYANDGRVISVKGIYSPRLTQFSGVEGLNVTPYVRMDKPLAESIPNLTAMVQGRINDGSSKFQFRREFIATLLVLKGKSISEYDFFFMKHISFLCEVRGRYYFVKICLGEKFPDESPTISIESYHRFSEHQQGITKSDLKLENFPEKVADKMAILILHQLKTHLDR